MPTNDAVLQDGQLPFNQRPKDSLPPIEKEALDGYHEEATLHRDQPIQSTCIHKMAKLISSTEIKCDCGVGWIGPNILALYNALKSQ